MRAQKAAIGQQTKKGNTLFSGESKRQNESDDPMIDCGALYVMSDVDGVQSEKRVVCKIKLTKKNKFHVKQNIRGGRFT